MISDDKAQTPPPEEKTGSTLRKGAILSRLQLIISYVSWNVRYKYSNFFGKFVTCKE